MGVYDNSIHTVYFLVLISLLEHTTNVTLHWVPVAHRIKYVHVLLSVIRVYTQHCIGYLLLYTYTVMIEQI